MKSTLTLLALAALLTLTPAVPAQSFHLLHTFEETDGLGPGALMIDSAGNLFGSAVEGGIHNCSIRGQSGPGQSGCGTIFELSMKNSQWVFKTLYQFQSDTDGWGPNSPLTLGVGGNLYGTTLDKGGEGGGGKVFRLRPTCKDLGCKQIVWSKTTLYSFVQCKSVGTNGGLVLDAAGNLYGTTIEMCGHTGEAYKLSPAQNLDGTWNKTTLHVFQGPPADGLWPEGPMVFDRVGNLYGTTLDGGTSDLGTVYRLTPNGNTWTECVLHSFIGPDGQKPIGSVIFDGSGDLFGVTYGDTQTSSVFELTPAGCNNVPVNRLYTFLPAQNVTSGLVMDADGNLYGVSRYGGANGYGSVYKLTFAGSGWAYSTVYDFTGGSDGSNAQGPLVLDAHGNLYGSAAAGGDSTCNSGEGCGTAWMIALN